MTRCAALDHFSTKITTRTQIYHTMTSKILVLAFLTVLAAARTFSGADPNFGELNQTFTAPTINHAVKVPIGNKNFSLDVMIAEFEPPANTATDLQNPRVAATIYELSWPWNTTINETLKTLEGVEEPRFCVSIPLGPIPDSVTKAYKETDLGDCTNALGEQCTRDLKNQGFAPDVGCNTPIPESCSGKLGSGSVGSARKVLSHVRADYKIHSDSATALLNIEQKYYSAYEKSEARFAYTTSEIYSAGNDTLFQHDVQRLHVLLLTSSGSAPICVRVADHKVSGARARPGGSMCFVALLALGAMLFMI